MDGSFSLVCTVSLCQSIRQIELGAQRISRLALLHETGGTHGYPWECLQIYSSKGYFLDVLSIEIVI